jgi:deoxyribodipyrimidine photolyase-related protein
LSVAALVYPHQLFEPHPAIETSARVFLVEEPLLLTRERFHRQKLILHLASMAEYADRLRRAGRSVTVIGHQELTSTGDVARLLLASGVTRVRFVDPNDDWLERRLNAGLNAAGLPFERLADPHFLTPDDEIAEAAATDAPLRFTDFYIRQRRRLGVLLEGRGKPVGGKWSFDPENRKRLPKGIDVPVPWTPAERPSVSVARERVRREFPEAIGADEPFRWPVTPDDASRQFDDFLERRFARFGDFEDAISVRHETLFHSALTPALNVGLIAPSEILTRVLKRADRVPLNALEGFVRQIIGWREFVRLVYRARGRRQRTRNDLGNDRPIPAAFYTGTTGLDPVDHVIRRVLASGYCHHIERLMVLGNVMLLCDLAPAEVCRWFMELFIDAYDWVMVPNVHGMSQYADGGMMTTKPYVSGSAYVLKMSDFRRGPWCEIHDALYWRFIDRHAERFRSNPRMAVIVRARDKLGDRFTEHRRRAETFLERLHAPGTS